MELVTGEQTFKVCNLTYLKNFAGGDKDFIKQMIELFFMQVPAELNNIDLQANAGNFNDVKNTAHKLKSSVALLGADSMASRLKQVEDVVTAGADSEQILALHHELVLLFNEAQEELNAYLAVQV